MPRASAAPRASGVPRVLLLQPPFVQLNSPYPSTWYLSSFLAGRGIGNRVTDHSIGLFERIFCREGFRRVFGDARPAALARLAAPPPAGGGAPSVDGASESAIRFNLSRFLSQERLWLGSIDRLVAYLRGQDPEYAHVLAAANGATPDGPRLDRFLQSVDFSPSTDDAPVVASLLLADFADFVTTALDANFALVRYAESLSASVREFPTAEKAASGWILSAFYAPLLEAEWDKVEAEAAPTVSEPFILACTIPFPGCLGGALFAARSAKARFGSRVRTLAGGGYVNTELRSVRSARFFDYFDYLCFDRGYGSLSAVLDAEGILAEDVVDGSAGSAKGALAGADGPRGRRARGQPLYRTIYRAADGASLVSGIDEAFPALPEDAKAGYTAIDAEGAVSVLPDYRKADFSRYIRPVDDANAMHRLWSDGRWLKAYLAHGCYWHACAFCDVALDYIRGYAEVDPDRLFAHLVAQAEATGIRGVHLVDEAAPPASLLRLADLNRAAGLPLSFWGNIRFERAFTADVAAALATGGLLGVSAGIEVASERGFKRLGKGLGLADVVHCCAAFKEAGVLVHAYLIFGFWDEDEGETVDSAETMRQIFKAGLVDSAFWHKFVLTRHSRAYSEWTRGRHPGLHPEGDGPGTEPWTGPGPRWDFADNDLRFRGEERSEKFSVPLDALMAAWMAGEAMDSPVRQAFPFKVPAPTVRPDLVESILDGYAMDRDREREAGLGTAASGGGLPAGVPVARGKHPVPRAVFLGGAPVPEALRTGGVRLGWRFRLEARNLDLAPDVREGNVSVRAEAVAALLAEASSADGLGADVFGARLAEALGEEAAKAALPVLRSAGLVVLPTRS
ncbi:MAG: hypothetical protein A2Z99_00010 [Treponema sp. GWB1_62_6]|nr:MAG: hypothetical protein A2Z99_00010 [Treponema sp. GWB1_62_6]OHE67967.1 MAG: hypothetical protein A2413_06825 [Treponema sp. RIFOXYC1_FULL_61_9]